MRSNKQSLKSLKISETQEIRDYNGFVGQSISSGVPDVSIGDQTPTKTDDNIQDGSPPFNQERSKHVHTQSQKLLD